MTLKIELIIGGFKLNLKENIEDFFLKAHIKNLLNKFNEYQWLIEKDIETMSNKELITALNQLLSGQQKKINELQTRNNFMHKVMENNEIFRGLDTDLNYEQEKHMVKLLKCNTKEEAAAEVVWHFAREHEIKEKYKERYQDKGVER